MNNPASLSLPFCCLGSWGCSSHIQLCSEVGKKNDGNDEEEPREGERFSQHDSLDVWKTLALAGNQHIEDN